MRRDRWFLFLGITLLVGLVLANLFSGIWGKKFFAKETNVLQESQRLHSENIQLKTELALLSEVKSSIAEEAESVPAFVYSRYPFNLKSELLINAGKDKGIKEGDIITFQGLFLGKIKEVYSDSALAQTIFDSHFETAVRIGVSGVDSLLKGGSQPVLSMIPKNISISEGDVVYSSSRDLPYGMAIGEAKNFSVKDQNPFAQAELDLSYSPSNIRVIQILKR